LTEVKRNQKQTGFEVKTFPVPFALENIKENISITSNTPSKPSNEQIIGLAFKLQSKGNISKAAKYYQYLINQGVEDYRIFSNYGVILKDLGKLKQAELTTRKAIKLNPLLAEAHTNLGVILQGLGNLKEAEMSYRKAIEIQPDYANAYLSLGNLLIAIGKLQEAEPPTRKAIKLKPDFANAHLSLGNILKALGKLQDAEMSYRKAIEIQPDYANALSNLGNVLKDLGNLKEAETSTRKAIELEPNLLNAHLSLGEILFDLGKSEEANISDWNAIKLNPSFSFIKSYRENAKSINKIALYIYSISIFNHFRPIIEVNPSNFDILIPDEFKKESIDKMRDFLRYDIKIIKVSELLKNNLIYEKLVSNRGDHDYKFIENKNNLRSEMTIPIIKLAGKKNIRLLYTAGKDRYTIYSYWNKYYDGILCYGPYHEDKFRLRHNIPTAQMGYPRFDKYFKPGFQKEYLIKKFKCDPKKKTIVWLTTWGNLSSLDYYLKTISLLSSTYNIVVRPHPQMKTYAPETYKKMFTLNFNYVDDSSDDNVQLFALADLMIFDYGGSMFGAIYLNKNLAFLEMNQDSKQNAYLGEKSSEDYVKSFFPDRLIKLENLKTICDYCLKNPPKNSILGSLREDFFNTNYQGNSAKRAFDLLNTNDWLS